MVSYRIVSSARRPTGIQFFCDDNNYGMPGFLPELHYKERFAGEMQSGNGGQQCLRLHDFKDSFGL